MTLMQCRNSHKALDQRSSVTLLGISTTAAAVSLRGGGSDGSGGCATARLCGSTTVLFVVVVVLVVPVSLAVDGGALTDDE